MIATRQKRILRRQGLAGGGRTRCAEVAAALVQLKWVLFFLPGGRYAGFILMD
jgi:hypothetical protein